MYEKIYELDTEDTVTPVSTDPSVPSAEIVTDGADLGLDRQDSTLSADELAAIRAKFFRLVHGIVDIYCFFTFLNKIFE